MQKHVAAMYQVKASWTLVAHNIGVLERDRVRQPGLPAARLGDLKHIPRQIDAMYARAERLGDQKRRPAKATSNIKDIHIRREFHQAEDIACGGFTAGADEIAPVDRFVLVDFVQAVL